MRSSRVVKPLVGISCCTKQFGIFGMPNHAASDTYVVASDQIIGAVPVLIPANGPTADIETLLERLDGIMLTGSRSNVHPSYYDVLCPVALLKNKLAPRAGVWSK